MKVRFVSVAFATVTPIWNFSSTFAADPCSRVPEPTVPLFASAISAVPARVVTVPFVEFSLTQYVPSDRTRK